MNNNMSARNLENIVIQIMLVVIVVETQGRYAVYRTDEKNSMGHCKEIEITSINTSGIPTHWKHVDFLYISNKRTNILDMFWTEPPFRANLL